MSFFNPFKSKKNNHSKIASELLEYVLSYVEKEGKGVRAEDAIVVLGTIIGERIVDAAGHLSLDEHDYHPGASIFSDRVNEIIYGDTVAKDIKDYPGDSVIGQLRDHLKVSWYGSTDFPSIQEIIESYANDVNVSKLWGTCTWLVPPANFPVVLPIKEGYETREKVKDILNNITDKNLRIEIAILALIELLGMMKNVIDPKTALTLIIQSINVVSKMAPMTDKAMNQYLLTGEYSKKL